jgi:hypothetical protein
MKKIFLSILLLFGTFFFSNETKASYLLEYQTGVRWDYPVDSSYYFIKASGVANEFWQEIKANECVELNENEKCEINYINFYGKNYNTTSGRTTNFALYESDTLPTNRSTVGTTIKTFVIDIPIRQEAGELTNFYQEFSPVQLDPKKFYTLHLKINQNVEALQMRYYTGSNVYSGFTKYFNINDSFPNWRNWNYDFAVWFGNVGDFRGINYDYNLSDIYPDFNTVSSQICIMGETCNLWFSYNSLAIGHVMYLTNYNEITSPTYAVASTTILSSVISQNFLTVPEPEAEANYKYNMFIEAEGIGRFSKSGITIKWVSPETWNELNNITGVNFDNYCSVETICSDVATSSDFLFGVQCGMRQTVCWIFAPTEKSKVYFSNSVNSLQNSFPFNLYFSIVNTIGSVAESHEDTEAEAIGIPFINGNGDFVMLPVISSSTMPNALGSSFDTVKTGLRAIIWLFVGLFITLIIYKSLW